jgi:hypothetical protein
MEPSAELGLDLLGGLPETLANLLDNAFRFAITHAVAVEKNERYNGNGMRAWMMFSLRSSMRLL